MSDRSLRSSGWRRPSSYSLSPAEIASSESRTVPHQSERLAHRQNGVKYTRAKPPLGVAEAGHGNIRARLRRADGCRNLICPLIKALRLVTITTPLTVPPVSPVRFNVSAFPPKSRFGGRLEISLLNVFT